MLILEELETNFFRNDKGINPIPLNWLSFLVLQFPLIFSININSELEQANGNQIKGKRQGVAKLAPTLVE